MVVPLEKIQNSLTPALLRHQWGESFICGYLQAGPTSHGWRPTGRKDWLFLYTTAGHGRVRFQGGEYQTSVGDGLLIAPGTPQDYRRAVGAEIWESIWVHFHPRGHVLPWLRFPPLAAGVGVLPVARTERAVVEKDLYEMLRVAGGSHGRDGERALNFLERVLLHLDGLNPLAGEGQYDFRIQRVLEESARRLGRSFPIPEMAQLAGMSVSRFCALFRTETGTSPSAYHLHARLSRGRELLEGTKHRVQQIADELGFSSAYHFSAAFRKYVGKSPRELRSSAVPRDR